MFAIITSDEPETTVVVVEDVVVLAGGADRDQCQQRNGQGCKKHHGKRDRTGPSKSKELSNRTPSTGPGGETNRNQRWHHH